MICFSKQGFYQVEEICEMEKGKKLENIRKVAIVRANGFGDIFLALPAIEALRAVYPGIEITWFGQKLHTLFLQGRGIVEKVVEIPPYPGVTAETDYTPDLKLLENFFSEIHREKFDLVIQMHGGGKYSNGFALKLGGRVTIGTKTQDAPDIDLSVPYFYFHNEFHRWLEVVCLVGAKPVIFMPAIKIMERDLLESYQVLPEDDRKIIVLHPRANDPKKCWPIGKFAEAGNYFSQKGYRVVISGTASECAIIDTLIKGMSYQADNLCGILDLNGLAGLLTRSSLLITNDTGPRHLADSLNTPTVGLYWCGNVINYAPITRDRHRILISWLLHCPVCGKDVSHYPSGMNEAKCHRVSYMENIPVSQVIEAAEELL